LQERVAALWEAIRTEVHADPSLNCLVTNLRVQAEGFRMTAPANSAEGWRQAVVDGRIRVLARI
jgi:hypothetical protein